MSLWDDAGNEDCQEEDKELSAAVYKLDVLFPNPPSSKQRDWDEHDEEEPEVEPIQRSLILHAGNRWSVARAAGMSE